jgi:hypothetical protein
MKIKNIFLPLLVCACFTSEAQVVTVFAGNLGSHGYGGDGSPATASGCKMNKPTQITHDAAGNIYFIDYNNYVVRKVSTSGVITTIAGTGNPLISSTPNPTGVPATSVDLGLLSGLAVDAAGNVYFGEDDQIRKVTTSGTYTNYAGTGVPGPSGDGGPATAATVKVEGLAFNPAGDLFISFYNSMVIRKISTATGIITSVVGPGTMGTPGDGGPATNAYIGITRDVEFDAAGNMYILGEMPSNVRKVTPSGIISTIAGTNGTHTPGFSGDGGPAINAKFDNPSELAVDNWNNVYILDQANWRIRRVTASGIISTYAGTGSSFFNGHGLAATATNISVGNGMDISGGYLYFSEDFNGLIRRTAVVAAASEIGNMNGEAVNIHIWPMPCGETFTVSSALFSSATSVEFTDVTGREVQLSEMNSADRSKQYSTSGMAPGIYFLRIVSADGTYTAKLIKG